MQIPHEFVASVQRIYTECSTGHQNVDESVREANIGKLENVLSVIEQCIQLTCDQPGNECENELLRRMRQEGGRLLRENICQDNECTVPAVAVVPFQQY